MWKTDFPKNKLLLSLALLLSGGWEGGYEPFIDINEIIAGGYDKLGQEKVNVRICALPAASMTMGEAGPLAGAGVFQRMSEPVLASQETGAFTF